MKEVKFINFNAEKAKGIYMTREELHDHINELADKVKYLNEGIRQSRFVEEGEVDLLEKYVNALQKDSNALRSERSESATIEDQPFIENESSIDAKQENHEQNVHPPSESDSNNEQQPDTSPLNDPKANTLDSPGSEAAIEGKDEPPQSEGTTIETYQEEDTEPATEYEESSGQQTGHESEGPVEEKEDASTSSIPDDSTHSAKITQQPSQDQEEDNPPEPGETEPEQKVTQQNLQEEEMERTSSEKAFNEQEKGEPEVEQEANHDTEQMPEYIKQLLANKEERDQSWEDLEQEADEYGGQSYVQKIRELKRKADINPEKPTLNERLKKNKPELSERINRHIHDIREAIGVNDRYLFISELFNNDAEAYKQTIDELNQLKSKEDAERYVKDNLEPMKGWQDNPRIAEKMNELIIRRFEKS